MKALSTLAGLIVMVIWFSSCTPGRGCTEMTADNYDPEAKQDDGTCIPARDKMIGNYTYTRIWTDVFTEVETYDVGSFQVTEANTAGNAFNMFLNGNQIIQGSVSALNISIENFSEADTFYGFPYTFAFTGQGKWQLTDTVDMTYNLTTQFPIDYVNGQFVKVPLTYYYYCQKVD